MPFVYYLKNNSNQSVKIEFKKISRHKATVFNGLCSQHDTEIFKPIDVQDLDVNNKEQVFLFTYRSVIQELATLIEAFIRCQELYLKKVDMGLLPKNTPCAEGIVAVEMMMQACEWYEIKKTYDLAYLKQDYDCLFCKHIILEKPTPFAVSSIFTPIEMSAKSIKSQTFSEIERIAINIFPYNNMSYIIFSCTKKDKLCMEKYVKEVFSSEGDYQKYLLSKLVLRNCENIVFSPTFVEKLIPTKKEAIINFFHRTIYTDDINFEDTNIYLFD